ncbi:hypothetical protein C8R47DRAFT_1214128 [Mycena vitilis]|nr:hypothetical protein C8R47DRAFT_1214128 [Mycena vitilis]
MSNPLAINDCPILVWMLVLNREYTAEATSQQAYGAFHAIVNKCVENANIPCDPPNAESFRQVMKYTLPLLMMRHRKTQRAMWRDCITPDNRHWIEQVSNSMKIGYHLAHGDSLCGMAMAQGTKEEVVRIGLGIKQLAVEPRGISVETYLESMKHKLANTEMERLNTYGPDTYGPDEVVLRRLCVILALKAAYLRASGQSVGVDLSLLDFDIPNKTARDNRKLIQGWEFRIFQSRVGVGRKDKHGRHKLVEEHYQCVCAFFRGGQETSFRWYTEIPKDLESWVQFINLDQMDKAIPKLTDYCLPQVGAQQELP